MSSELASWWVTWSRGVAKGGCDRYQWWWFKDSRG